MDIEEQPDDVYTVELVWDADLEATAVAGGSCACSGEPLRVGAPSGWLPGHHLMLAVASSFMEAFLLVARAQAVPILGYVSVAKLHISRGTPADICLTLTPCIVVGTAGDAVKIDGLAALAADRSDICRMVRERLRIDPVRVTEQAGEAPV